MSARPWLSGALALALAFASALAQEGAPPPADAVRIASALKAKGPEAIEWTYTLDCLAQGMSPSLRVTISHFADYSANAGVTLPVDDQDRAVGTIRLRVALADKAARTYTLTAEVGPGGPTLLGQTLHLEPGQELAAVTALQELPATAGFRRAIVLGNVGGCLITAYVMPGRASARDRRSPVLPTSSPAADAVALFGKWVRGVKSGNLEQFAAGMAPAEWSGLTPEQRQQRLREYQSSFTTVLGADFDPERFQVEYVGSAAGGKLNVRYGDKELPALNVRASNGAWILAEP